MEGPPAQIRPKSLDDYLEQLSKSAFQAGISWRVVDAKWSGIKTAFKNFEIERVARMGDRDIDKLMQDERVIRSRGKLEAVVHNANAILELERERGFKKHLKSFDDYEDLAKDLKKRFKFVGDSGMYHFLWTVRHPVPEWRDWAKTHGVQWGDMKKPKPRAAARPRAKMPTRAKAKR